MKNFSATVLLPTVLFYISSALAAEVITCTPAAAEDIAPYLQKLGAPDGDGGIPAGHCTEEWVQKGVDAFRDCAEKNIIHGDGDLEPRPKEDLLCGGGDVCVAFPASPDTSYHCLDPETGDYRTPGGSDENWVIGSWVTGNFAMPNGLTGNFYTGGKWVDGEADADAGSDTDDSGTGGSNAGGSGSETGANGADNGGDTPASAMVVTGGRVVAPVAAVMAAIFALV